MNHLSILNAETHWQIFEMIITVEFVSKSIAATEIKHQMLSQSVFTLIKRSTLLLSFPYRSYAELVVAKGPRATRWPPTNPPKRKVETGKLIKFILSNKIKKYYFKRKWGKFMVWHCTQILARSSKTFSSKVYYKPAQQKLNLLKVWINNVCIFILSFIHFLFKTFRQGPQNGSHLTVYQFHTRSWSFYFE